MISPFVSIAGKPQSKMITYTHCFDLKCKCKWQIPFQIQLGTERSLFVCNWPLNKVRRKSFSFISSSPTIFFFCRWLLCNPCENSLPHAQRKVHLSGVLPSIPISCSGHAHSTLPAHILSPPLWPFYGHVRKCGKSFTRSGWRRLPLQVEDVADDDVTSVK